MKLRILLLFGLYIFIILPIGSQNIYVLTTIQKGESYSYKNLDTQEVFQFNITDRYVHGSGTDAIFINNIISNTSPFSPIPNVFQNLDKFQNNVLTLGLITESWFNNSAKGNFPVSIIENRSSLIFNHMSNNSVIYYNNSVVKINYDIADRALTVLRGEPITDTLIIEITADYEYLDINLTNMTMLDSIFDPLSYYYSKISFDVLYIPSDFFNITYKGKEYSAINITESFSNGQFNSHIKIKQRFDDRFASSFADRVPIFKSPNIYTFVPKIGLPVAIQTSSSIQNSSSLLFKPDSNIFSQPDIVLDDYSWEESESSYTSSSSSSNSSSFSSTTTIPINILTMMLILPIIYVKRKRDS